MIDYRKHGLFKSGSKYSRVKIFGFFKFKNVLIDAMLTKWYFFKLYPLSFFEILIDIIYDFSV